MTDTTTEAPLHVVSLVVENVKRIQAVTIRPDGNVIVVGGANAQGKTSLLDSLEFALGGGKTLPVEPVRRGARKARIVADLGELVVERTFSPKGSELRVRGADGAPIASPQKLLDTLCSKVAFDPYAFTREEPKKQDEILRRIVGIDFTALDAKRAAAYAARTDVQRDVKRVSARLDTAVIHGVPDQEVSVAELTQELERGRDTSAANDVKRDELRVAKVKAKAAHEEIGTKVAEIKEIEEALASARAELADLENEAAVERQNVVILEEQVAALVEPDLAPLREQIRTAEVTNQKVRENRENKKLEQELKALEAKAADYTATIEEIDAVKAQQLSEAKFPVPGLGFDDAGPTLNGIPLEQASQAERLRVSVAIGAALNPRVRVMLVRDGSLLDSKSMALLAQLAEETGSQVWVERVSEDGVGCSVVIEDGTVREAAAAE